MYDLLWLFVAVVCGDATVMAIFVLVLNPKMGAAATKRALLQDPVFIPAILDRLLAPELAPKYEPLMEKLRLKLQGTLLSEQALDKTVDRMISTTIKESNPDVSVAIDLIKSVSPKYGKFLNQHPELAPKILERLKKRGLIPEGINPDEGYVDPYGS